MKVNDIFQYVTDVMFIMTISDPIDIHMVDTINVFYKIFLASYLVNFAITCYFANLDKIPTLIILSNAIKIFIPSYIIGNNEFIALYHRASMATFIIILSLIIGKKYATIASMFISKQVLDNFDVNVTVMVLLKTLLTLVPTLFKYSGYQLYFVILFDILKVILLCTYIVVKFSKFKNSKKKEQEVNNESDSEEVLVNDVSDTTSDEEMTLDQFDNDNDDDDTDNENSDIDFESFMSTLGVDDI